MTQPSATVPAMATAGAPPRALSGAGTLWHQLAADLRQRITAGEFRDGFAGEMALVTEYGVSRHTVREALRDLRREGLITATRGKTSQVVDRPMIEQPTSTLYSLFAAVESAGHTQRSTVLTRDVRIDPTAAEHLELAPDTPLTYLERLRLIDGEPLAIDRVYLPAARTSALHDADFSNTSLYRQLRETCHIAVTGGRERVSAAVPDAWTRAQLEIDESVAVLSIERLGLADGQPVEWRRTMLRGDRYQLTAHYPSHERGRS